jgi:flavodoxin
MSKVLVAYYSWTGHTRRIAEAVAAELGADLEPIREVRPRSGWMAYFRSAWESLRGKPAPIKVPAKDAAAYDLVVLGTPVWAGYMSSPLRSYIADRRASLARIALFCSEGGASGEKALADIGAFCGKEPVATLIVKEQELSSGAWRQKVADFTKALK